MRRETDPHPQQKFHQAPHCAEQNRVQFLCSERNSSDPGNTHQPFFANDLEWSHDTSKNREELVEPRHDNP